MKKRLGYVSNSSSSSFLCEICGNIESGYDACAEDLGLRQCENGHCFCEWHELDAAMSVPILKNFMKKRKDSGYYDAEDKKIINDFLNDENISDISQFKEHDRLMEIFSEMEREYGCDFHKCPLCMMKEISMDNLYLYVLKKYSLDRDDVEKEIKNRFSTYDEFMNFLKSDN